MDGGRAASIAGDLERGRPALGVLVAIPQEHGHNFKGSTEALALDTSVTVAGHVLVGDG